MNHSTKRACSLALVTLTVGVAIAFGEGAENGDPTKPAPAKKGSSAGQRSSVEEARREAEAIHTAIHSTLHVVHHRCYREEESLPLPAAILKEVFSDLEEERNVKLRWLAVEGQAMSSDHRASNPFEEEAVRALSSGKQEFEQVEKGVYRRAGAIALTNHCLKCHVPDRKSTRQRTAGLIIAIPVAAK